MMREPGQMLRQPKQRRWIIIAGVVFLLLLSFGSLISFYVDLLWFDEIKLRSVFTRILWARTGLGFVGGLAAGIALLVNLEVTRLVAPRYRFVVGGGEVAERYRSLFQPYARWVNLGTAALVGLLTGLSSSAAWERFLLWRAQQPFGTKDALFGRDVGFYVFAVPWQRAMLSWAFGVVIVSILFSGLGHLLNGSIEPEANRVVVRPAVKVHLSVLLGVIALLKAWGYQLAQYDLLTSPRGTTTGASFTDVNAQLPALRLLVIFAVISAVILFVNFRFQGWLLPAAAAGIWLFASIVIGGVYPWAIQRFRVEPNESQREAQYIKRNIEATRRAFRIDGVNLKEFPISLSLDDAALRRNAETLDNIRLWNPETLLQSFQRLQAIRTYYDFKDVDIDRYRVDGKLRQVMLSPREIDISQLEARAANWINQKLTYSHGYGVVAIPASSVTSEGQPNFIVRDLPPDGPPELVPEKNGIYYGESLPGYVIVKTKQKEIDYPIGEENATSTYDGSGGIALSNPMRRLAFAWALTDTNVLISSFVNKESRVIIRRDILERARTAAPFLRFDRDPYIVSANGRLMWVIDAYTTTDRYPYSQELRLQEIFGLAQPGTVNYIRNSVKVVVDAFDGSMKFYVVDPDDAIVATYQKAFPEMFTPADQMTPELQAHLRYPEDLFIIQSWQYRLYHTTDPGRVYSREDIWDFPADPNLSDATTRAFLRPYYVLMKLPGEEKAEFLLMMPFTPRNKPNLNGWVAGRSDPGVYGQLVGFSFPRGQGIDGPENVSARIEQDSSVSQQITLWDQAGSRVLRGNLLVIPIETSLIYVQPLYLQAQKSAIPELRRVVVVYGNNIGFEPTFEAALRKALTGQPPSAPTGEGAPAPPPADVAALLQRAGEHFQRADLALRNGDLATYQKEITAAREAIVQAQRQTSSG